MSKKMGRPPKNMCHECRGWGELYTQDTLITYFGDGDIKSKISSEQPMGWACEACNGTGYTGGKLRQGTPPVMEQWTPATPKQSPPAADSDDDTTTKGLVL
jgi:hypothetical protein